jgi:nucleoside-diphosphate-sugar epimerase
MSASIVGSGRAAFKSVDRVLVTGGGGFIGTHLVAHLRRLGKSVVAPSRGDGFDVLSSDFPLSDIDHVFHLAAETGVVESWEDPVSFHQVNAHGTVRLLEQCRHRKCSITYVSGYVYGRTSRLPVRETDNVEASNPYAFSKFMAEEACRFYARVFGLPVAILRPFNVYGPGQSDRFLLPHIVRQALDPDCAMIRVLDLAPRRDYVYISDVIEAALSVMVARPGETFNVGSGTSHSVEDVIRTVLSSAGIQKPYGCPDGKVRANEIDNVIADISAIRRSLGWSPATSFDEGLKNLIESMR